MLTGPVNVAPERAAPPKLACVVVAVPEPENESGPVKVQPVRGQPPPPLYCGIFRVVPTKEAGPVSPFVVSVNPGNAALVMYPAGLVTLYGVKPSKG